MIKNDEEMLKAFKIYDKLTDKKLLNIITKDEEIELEKVRIQIEDSVEDSDFVHFLEDRIKKYQEMLKELKDIKARIKKVS